MKNLTRTLLSLGFIGSGILHFLSPNAYTKIVPAYLPAAKTLVYVSGIFEILGGVGILVPKSRQFSARGLIALLVAVFPANLYHATANVHIDNMKLLNNRTYQWLRLPFQLVFIWLVVWSNSNKTK